MRQSQAEKPLTEAEEIEAMLPWLVAGTLTRAEEARVTRYLETHPDAAAHVALAREEQDAAIDVNEAIRAPRTCRSRPVDGVGCCNPAAAAVRGAVALVGVG